MSLGIRVLRGPDWDQNEADGGEGHLGTVVGVKVEEGTAEVVWDRGQVTTCRIGKEGKHDLSIFDNATVGVQHPQVACSGCGKSPVPGLLWCCAVCPNLSLCSQCYAMGVHDAKHDFQRFTGQGGQGVGVGRRFGVPRVRTQGIFPGAKVVRGPDWQAGHADGGPGGRGVVVELLSPESGSARNAVRVSWDSGQSLQHRLGLQGKVDLLCTEEAPGPTCYPSHLPELDVEHFRADSMASQAGSAGSDVTEGDRVRVPVDEEAFREKQKLGSGSSAGKAKAEGGAETIKEGDTVRIISDVRLLEEHQKDHGGWNDAMTQAAGKVGSVIAVDDSGDLVVKFGQEFWVFNPDNCRLAPGEAVDVIPLTGIEGTLKGLMEGLHKQVAGLLRGRLSKKQAKFSESLTGSSSVVHLFEAVATGDTSRVAKLLESEPNLVNEIVGGATALHYATSNGQVEVVRLLVEKGCNVNKGDEDDDTPLLLATYANHTETAMALLELGADVSLSNEDGQTALHAAVIVNSLDIVRLLLQHGASVNKKDVHGDTPLFDALQKDGTDAAIVDALLTVGDLDLTMTNQETFNVLHVAAQRNRKRAVEKILARCPNSVKTAADQRLFTALHLATLNEHTDVVKLLLEAGAPVNPRNNIQQTPLHLACKKDFLEGARLLVENGADINATDMIGNTPLHASVVVNPVEMMLHGLSMRKNKGLKTAEYLLQRGARTDMRNLNGLTPLDAATDDVREKLKHLICQISKLKFAKEQNIITGDEKSSPSPDAPTGSKCSTCRQHDADVIFLPCAHKVTCRQCTGSAKVCLECGEVIAGRVDTDGNPVEPPPSSPCPEVEQPTEGEELDCKVQ